MLLANAPKIKYWIKSFFYALLFVVFLKGCVGDFTYIVSPSMNTTLYEGDFIYINKLAYSPRLVRTPICFPFSIGKWYSNAIQFPYYRIFGNPGVEKNDIIIFNSPLEIEKPVDQREQYVKRVIALPGDTLLITNAKSFVNGKAFNDSIFCLYNYLVKTKSIQNDSLLFSKYNLSVDAKISEDGHYSFFMLDSVAKIIALDSGVAKITKQLENKHFWNETVFPYKMSFAWNGDQFGPLYIPKKGDTIKVDSSNFNLYERVITVYEGNVLELINGKYYINGDSSSSYVIKMNYYFVMGDNRHDSKDSRYFGFLPEDHIISKASFIFCSYNKIKSEFRKGRWLKNIATQK